MPIPSRDGGGLGGFTLRGEDAAMKTCLLAMIALSVLVGIATPAGAFDTKQFFEQQNRWNGGSNGQ
jgi:hypothetical protein